MNPRQLPAPRAPDQTHTTLSLWLDPHELVQTDLPQHLSSAAGSPCPRLRLSVGALALTTQFQAVFLSPTGLPRWFSLLRVCTPYLIPHAFSS